VRKKYPELESKVSEAKTQVLAHKNDQKMHGLRRKVIVVAEGRSWDCREGKASSLFC
jgi:hypothetical protein